MEKINIAILGTLDTKGEEVAYMKRLIEDRGHSVTTIDVGPVGPPGLKPDITNEYIAKLGGWELSKLVKCSERDLIMNVMGKGAMRSLLELFKNNRINAVIALGGNQGSAIASMAMKGLPIGFPKYLVSTVASGNIRPYVGCKDIGIVFSVGDFLGGPNTVTCSILANAVSAVVGMAEHGTGISVKPGERIIAISALGNTEPAASRAAGLFRENGFQVIPFHASGAGGSAMEELISDGIIHGVLDLTPHELTEEIVGAGAYVPVTPGRLKAAGAMGIPQVVSTGGMEYICFGPRESIPAAFKRRKIYMHNPYNANVRVTTSELVRVGRIMAERLNESAGPVEVLVPGKGWSVYGARGGPLHSEKGYTSFMKSLKSTLRANIRLEEVDAHINDSIFADRCARQLMDLMNR